jgi:hypothetical protein
LFAFCGTVFCVLFCIACTAAFYLPACTCGIYTFTLFTASLCLILLPRYCSLFCSFCYNSTVIVLSPSFLRACVALSQFSFYRVTFMHRSHATALEFSYAFSRSPGTCVLFSFLLLPLPQCRSLFYRYVTVGLMLPWVNGAGRRRVLAERDGLPACYSALDRHSANWSTVLFCVVLPDACLYSRLYYYIVLRAYGTCLLPACIAPPVWKVICNCLWYPVPLF